MSEPAPATFEELFGLEILECTPDVVRGRIAVGPKVKQPMGLVHGGVYAAMAESLASLGTVVGVHERGGEGQVVMGMSNATTFLRPVTEGEVVAVGHPRHRGRTTWIWDLEFTDDQDRLVALSRMTVAVRPAR